MLSDEQKQKLRRQVDDIKPEDEDRVSAAYGAAEKQARERRAERGLLEGVNTLWQMLKDPDYTMSWQTKAWILFGLGYFVSPIDLIPDVVPVLGYLDDALVIAWVLRNIHEEVVAYKEARGLAR